MFYLRLAYFIFFLLLSVSLSAQSTGQHSLYMVDIYNHNVAYAGFDRSVSANFNYRSQWAGINGQPNQVYVNAHLPVYLLNGGAGMRLSSDRSGGLAITELMLSYNRVRSFNAGIVSVGAGFGWRQTGVDGSVIRTPEGVYVGGFSHEDPILFNDSQLGSQLSWSLALYTATDWGDFGLSLNNLGGSRGNISEINFSYPGTLDIYGAIPFFVNDLKIQASLYIKTNFEQSQGELSILLKNGNIFGGLSARGFNENSLDSAVIIGGIKLNEHYTLSYSYDIGLSSLADYTQGSHEININYNLNKLIGIGLPPEIIYNPRNL